MAAKEKDAQELIELAAEQGKHAAKNVGAAASEAASEILPSNSGGFSFGFYVSNKTLFTAAGALGLVGAVAVANRIKRERDAKAKVDEGEKGQPKPMNVDKGPS